MPEDIQQLVLWAIPAAPLLSAVVTAFLGPKVLKSRSHLPCWSALAISFLCSLLLLFSVLPGINGTGDGYARESIVFGFEWLHVGTLEIPLQLRADSMSAIMLAMVTGVSLLVSMFGSGYMHHDPGYPRFFAAVSMFVFSMCMLVLSNNFAQLFVFWEMVGLCSYLLIGFWFHKPSAAAAAKKAFVVNRIGDFGLIMGIFLIWTHFGSIDFMHVLSSKDVIAQVHQQSPQAIPLICFCLFLGAMGKSAQFPLQVWLPDAMEGPTPVSALIHAATMVTAGVYLVARCTPLFVMAPNVQMFVTGIGAITAAIAALTALTQTDLKRVLAYSTVSQLGFMFMALGCGAAGEELVTPAVTAGMFHLFTHAYFKALLFLAAGSVMHAMGDIIDMRRFSGLKHALPITHWTFLVGAAALAGVPLLAGFWSKDDILAVLYEASHSKEHGLFFGTILVVACVTALLTAFYTFRAYFMTFWGPERFPEEAGDHPHEATPIMAWPLRILAVCAAFIGLAVGPTHLFASYLHKTVGLTAPEAHGLHWNIMALSTVIGTAGIGFAWMFYVASPGIPVAIAKAMKPFYLISQGKFFLDEVLFVLVVLPLRGIALIATLLDRFLIDGLIDSVGAVPGVLSGYLKRLQAGLVNSYAGVMWLGAVAVVVIALILS